MELNRDDIIKALECCLVESNCTGCPLHHQYETDCLKYAGEKAFSLINELTAENKLLNVELGNASSEILRLIDREKELTEENKRLRALYRLYESNALCEKVCEKSLVVNTVRKVLERLKEHSRKMQSSDFGGEFWCKAVMVETIDQIAEEIIADGKQ